MPTWVMGSGGEVSQQGGGELAAILGQEKVPLAMLSAAQSTGAAENGLTPTFLAL